MASQVSYRTEEKLRFAQIHLDELSTYPNATSNDEWEKAHQESCFFHFTGSVEALLHEINNGYSLGLCISKVKWNTVKGKLKSTKQASPAFERLMQLRSDKNSWLALLLEWRNHGAHRNRISKQVNMSTKIKVDNEFIDPRTSQPQKQYLGLGCLDVLSRLANDIRKLIDECRDIDPKL